MFINQKLDMVKNKKLLYTVTVSLSVAIILSLFLVIGLFETWEAKLSDTLFTQQQPLSDIVIVAIDDTSLQSIGRWPWNREVYAKYLPILSKAKVIGIDVAFFESSVNDTPLIETTKKLKNIVYPVEYEKFSAKEELIGTKILKPIPELAKVAAGLGHINLFTDSDGITRKVALTIGGIETFDSFSKVIAEEYLEKELTVPATKIIINYIGKPGTFTTISFSELKKFKEEDFEGKIMLIGATAPDLHDDRLVPTSKGKLMPGVEIHANIVQQLITRRFLFTESRALVIGTIFLLSLSLGICFYYFPIWINSLIAIIIAIGYIILTINQFDKGTVLNIFYPLATTIFSFFSLTGLYYFIELKEKRKIKHAFSKYVSPILVEEIMKNPERLRLGGEKRPITILFSDIRNFTTISETLGPEKLVAFLNEYLTEMTNIILKNNGLVDKYIGDAIMAFWGAPLDEKHREYLACKTCLEMVDKLHELRKGWKHLPHIDIGIGVNEGECVVGNIGSHERFDYTAIGDSVNLASRLEGLNKQYGTNSIVSESVYEKVNNNFIFRELDYVKVKGKKKPVQIYELIGTKVDDKKKRDIEIFENGFKKYLAEDFDGALKEFSKLTDKASQVFVERCKVLKENPPKEWDGSFEFKTK